MTEAASREETCLSILAKDLFVSPSPITTRPMFSILTLVISVLKYPEATEEIAGSAGSTVTLETSESGFDLKLLPFFSIVLEILSFFTDFYDSFFCWDNFLPVWPARRTQCLSSEFFGIKPARLSIPAPIFGSSWASCPLSLQAGLILISSNQGRSSESSMISNPIN